MTTPEGSSLGSQMESGTPVLQINNKPDVPIQHVTEFPIHENRPPAVQTGEPVIEITCSRCGELTSRTYPVEANGLPITTADDEIYPCSCPTPPV